MELDHVIVFVAGPESVAPLFPGFVLDPGMRHVGQGTRNRRVLFPRNYVEIVWIDDADQERRSGLGFAPRCAPDAPARSASCCAERSASRTGQRYVPYQVPAGGPALLLLGAALRDPSQPFVAVREDGGAPGARRSRSTRAAPGPSDARCCAARPSPTLVRRPRAVTSGSSSGGRGCGWSGTGRRPVGAARPQ